MTTVWLFVLLTLANGAPVIAARLLRQRWSAPIDNGRLWRDGRPLLGKSKTWRGLVAGILACALVAPIAGLSVGFGVAFGALALLGDLLSSFAKRRMGLAASARAAGLDQLPESTLPVVFAWAWLPIQVWQAVAVVVLFVATNVLLSPLLFRLGIRKQPH
ncbi:CDP-2,3-bis-(O-geranylgeranyl)-sn-glycerol synthase [Marinobacter daqiaonensis]|uniref:CDP-2,3-bis-(O-geranylgeranyl)-sn-glycerol synthase n=1 Tax=Marinobacter daqiaonensis TaxID=650891 RepID=A0A1I6HZD0_9GAMM|nr:CDP-archaeol synthase [Marinobacter daqiaonensis]SFR59768.1 CDP-2,3-bis-(O-geranylgeranyl)-sn-glycerol synthase [Marinobacter daqiaonensis]